MEVFNKLLETIEKGSIDNQITITNVDLFIKAWKREAESLQLRKTDVNGSFFKCTCLHPKSNFFSVKCSYCNRTIVKDITTDDL